MKIEQAFRDLKSLFRWDKIMNKTRRNIERMTAIVLLAYAIALIIGEGISEILDGLPEKGTFQTSGICRKAN